MAASTSPETRHPPRRVLIVGGDGLIGRTLAQRLTEAGCQTVTTTRRADGSGLPLDLSAPDRWPDLPKVDALVLCAAMTRLADCEAAPELSRAVNVDAPLELVRRTAGDRPYVLFLSTAQVFDGRTSRTPADAPTSPQTVYGRQKAEAEDALRQATDTLGILRLSKVLTPEDALLIRWREALQANLPVACFSDMSVAPVGLDFALDVIVRMLRQRTAGTIQASGDADIDYCAMAQAMADALGLTDPPLRPEKGADRLPHAPPYASFDAASLGRIDMAPPDSAALINDICRKIADTARS